MQCYYKLHRKEKEKMVIDKTGIMSILRTSEEDLKNHIGEIAF